ncbi:MAG TPA: trypsin-like peptidase domain-containing protein [Mycobacteriales bacterium]|nr:trypsin-like peptidase domain-containing protein [Mycobacteriales bacterium]
MPLPAAVRTGLAAALLFTASLGAPAVAGVPSRGSSPTQDGAQQVRCNLTEAPQPTLRGPSAPAPAPPLGTAPCTGVRPGAQIQTPHGPCSMGFLFAGDDGRRYVATAGHCVLDADGEKIWPRGSEAVAKDADGKRIGTAVYAIRQPIKPNGITDFALIRLDLGVASDPQMCHFGGPTSFAAEVDNRAAVFTHVGTGVAGLRSRSAVAPQGLYRADYVYAHGVAAPGDSGGALTRDDGAAVGLVTQLAYGPLGNIGINRLGPHVVRASQAIRVRLTLITAPLL